MWRLQLSAFLRGKRQHVSVTTSELSHTVTTPPHWLILFALLSPPLPILDRGNFASGVQTRHIKTSDATACKVTFSRGETVVGCLAATGCCYLLRDEPVQRIFDQPVRPAHKRDPLTTTRFIFFLQKTAAHRIFYPFLGAFCVNREDGCDVVKISSLWNSQPFKVASLYFLPRSDVSTPASEWTF